MEILASVHIPRMFESIILENSYSAEYTTIYHEGCDMAFGGRWERKYHSYSGYITGAKYFVCPKCGRYSNPSIDAIYHYHDEAELVPTSMVLELVSYKNFVDLRVRYEAIKLEYNGLSYNWGGCKQSIRFDFKRKKAFYIDRESKTNVELTTSRMDTFSPLPVLEYLNDSFAMLDMNKKAINDLFKTLRLEFERRLTAAYGYKPKELYIANSMNDRDGYGANQLRHLVYKLSAPDMPSINKLAKSHRKWNETYTWAEHKMHLNGEVFELTRKGMNFHEALRTIYLAPNNRRLKRLMVDDPFIVKLVPLLSHFNDTNSINELLRALYFMADRGRAIVNESIYAVRYLVSRFSEKQVVSYLLKCDTRDLRDTSDMLAKLTDKSKLELNSMKLKIKDVHDAVMELHDKQEFGTISLPTIQALNADVSGMHFMTPATAFDLKLIGSKLKNCVGSYSDRVAKGECAIVVVTDDHMKPVACLELKNTSINGKPQFNKLVQAKIFANKPTSQNETVNSAVLAWAEQLKIEPTTIDVEAHVS